VVCWYKSLGAKKESGGVVHLNTPHRDGIHPLAGYYGSVVVFCSPSEFVSFPWEVKNLFVWCENNSVSFRFDHTIQFSIRLRKGGFHSEGTNQFIGALG